jgi:predicted PurR-regulated permease PerM
MLTLSFYLSIREGGIEQFVRLITPSAHEDYVSDLWHRSQRKIGLWLQGQFILMFLVGLLTYVGLTILGVPNALLLGILTGLFEIIPFVGPILAAIPVVGFAALTGGVSLALMSAGLFIIIQQLENNFNKTRRIYNEQRLEYDRMIGPKEIYQQAREQGFVNAGPADQIITLEP